VQVYDVATSLAEHPVDPVSTADQVRVYVPVPVPPDAPVVTTENDSVAPTVAWFVEIVPADSAEFTTSVNAGDAVAEFDSESPTVSDTVYDCTVAEPDIVQLNVDVVCGVVHPDPAGAIVQL
jgi:hypothetical protein